MYRNGEHYPAPTEGQAITNVMAEMRYKRKRELDDEDRTARKEIQGKQPRIGEKTKALQQERFSHCQYVLVWKASEQSRKHLNRNRIDKE